MNRRELLSAAVPAAGFTILKSGLLRGQTAPSNKLNIALIGVWGRGTAHYASLKNENVVAICDVNELRTKEALQIFPKAKAYPPAFPISDSLAAHYLYHLSLPQSFRPPPPQETISSRYPSPRAQCF